MRVFLSYASDNRGVAEAIALSLRGRGHEVFFDRDQLPPGESFDIQIENAIAQSDILIFLISPESVAKGRYTLTELHFARRRWLSPDHRVLPVMVSPTPIGDIPAYLKGVSFVTPEGNVAAEVAYAAEKLRDQEYATRIGMKFLPFGAVTGLVAAFTPYKLGHESANSALGFELFHTPGDIGIVLGAAMAGTLWLILRKNNATLAVAFFACVAAWFAIVLFDPLGLEGDLSLFIRKAGQTIPEGQKMAEWLHAVVWTLMFVGAGVVASSTFALVASTVLSELRTLKNAFNIVAFGVLGGFVYAAAVAVMVRGGFTDMITLGHIGAVQFQQAPSIILAKILWMSIFFFSVGYVLGRGRA